MVHFNQHKMTSTTTQTVLETPIQRQEKQKRTTGGLKQDARTKKTIQSHKRSREKILGTFENNLIVCPIDGEKGIQIVKFDKHEGASFVYIKHLTGTLSEMKDGRLRRKTKLCQIGKIATDTWDVPTTFEGMQAVMADLITYLKGLVTAYYSKSPVSTTRSHVFAKELQNIVNQYERYVKSVKTVKKDGESGESKHERESETNASITSSN